MLLELAIGDAYGAGFEYVSAARVLRDNDLSRYVQPPPAPPPAVAAFRRDPREGYAQRFQAFPSSRSTRGSWRSR